MRLSLIIPVYNEELFIEKVVINLFKALEELDSNLEKEVLFINDGSTDQTKSILEKLKKDYPFVLINHETNYGKGRSMKTGLKHYTGDIIIFNDSDLECPFIDLIPLIKELAAGNLDAAFGSRFLNKENVFKYKIISWMNRIINFTLRCFLPFRFTDFGTAIKGFRKEIIDSLTLHEDGFAIDLEISAKVAKLPEIRLKEFPVRYFARSFEEGKKIGYSHTPSFLKSFIKYVIFSG